MADGARIIVCGGRHYRDAAVLWSALDGFADRLPEPGVRLVIDGASDEHFGKYRGADYWGHQWALARNIPTVRMPAKWETGRSAGPLRNQRMVDEFHPTHVIAFPGGHGTADMVRRARAAGIPVMEVTSAASD